MPKTDHNLKVLEKKIRQAVSLIDELRHAGDAPSRESEAPGYADLPLLKGLGPEEAILGGHAGSADRRRIRERIEKIIEEIEKVLD